MADFSGAVDTVEGKLEFHFTKLVTSKGGLYYVSVVGQPYLFHMEQRNGIWKIVDAPKVPQWIHIVEGYLAKLIAENQRALEE